MGEPSDVWRIKLLDHSGTAPPPFYLQERSAEAEVAGDDGTKRKKRGKNWISPMWVRR
jgi:hypothetical protein